MVFNSSKNDKIIRMNITENHNNTNEIYENIWKCLDKGVNDRLSDYHTFALATSPKNIVEVRTVVLRGYDRKNQSIIFHTNNLTNKISEIQNNPSVGALFYDRKEKVQIRLNGDAVISNMDQYCKERWDKMSSQSQECYYQNISPGKNIESPGIVKNKLENKLSENFTVITININKIDWLYLSSAGHTRVKFLKNDGFTGQWVAP
ncbi:MAG: pyridoxamine 5'-phosphate oxidase family protein [Gammaproteobacteria bacterium]|nr:pyridoxamine 5'-phosphate oxidase family protein [Gammaproteobacteria bacterium]